MSDKVGLSRIPTYPARCLECGFFHRPEESHSTAEDITPEEILDSFGSERILKAAALVPRTKLRQWIVHPDGTWIWSAERPVGGAPYANMFGRFENSLPVLLPDANDAKYPARYLKVPVLKPNPPGVGLLGVDIRELAYSRRRHTDGHSEWCLEP